MDESYSQVATVGFPGYFVDSSDQACRSSVVWRGKGVSRTKLLLSDLKSLLNGSKASSARSVLVGQRFGQLMSLDRPTRFVADAQSSVPCSIVSSTCYTLAVDGAGEEILTSIYWYI